MNLVFLNGTISPAEAAHVSLFDRGFLYGDGVFEAIRIQTGKPFRWTDHVARLEGGLRLIGIRLPYDRAALTRHSMELIAANRCTDGVLRVTVSRGPGARGYSPAGADSPTVAMSLHPRPAVRRPEGLRLISSTVRLLAEDPLAAVKSASKLPYIVARAEADAAGADDAILLNHREEIAEATSGNLFWMKGDVLHTPATTAGLLPGIARQVVMSLAQQLGLRVEESLSGRRGLDGADSIFVTNMISGAVEAGAVDGIKARRSHRFKELDEAFEDIARRETGA